MNQTETVSLAVGELYHFAGIPGERAGTWYARPADYRLVAVALMPRTDQQLAVYVGVGGRDDGNCYAVPLGDWHRNFVRLSALEGLLIAEPVPAAAPMPERVAGYPDTEGDKMKGLKL